MLCVEVGFSFILRGLFGSSVFFYVACLCVYGVYVWVYLEYVIIVDIDVFRF